MTTLKAKLKYVRDMGEKYPIFKARPKTVVDKIEKYGDELRANTFKMLDELDNPKNEILMNLSDKRYGELCGQISDFEVLTLDDIPELKKADSESDKESKKSLTKTQQNNLIRKIPDDMFTEAEILKIVEYIRNGTMTKVSQMPNPTKKEPKVPLSVVVKDNKLKKLKADVEPEAKAEPKPKTLKPVVKQGRPKKIKTKEQIKAEEKAIADKLKAKEAKLKPYFKIGEIPKGFRRASMQEAKEAGKINYWGLKAVDNKILNLTEETDPKVLKAKITEKTIKLGGLMGKFTKIKKDIAIAKSKNDNKEEIKLNADMNEVKKNILQFNNELNLLKEKLKKRTGTGLYDTNTDDDADSDDDNVTE